MAARKTGSRKKKQKQKQAWETIQNYYYGNDLGAAYTPQETIFKVWAPSASSVSMKRFRRGSSQEEGDIILEERPLVQDTEEDGQWRNGVWTIAIEGDLANTYYTYAVTVDGVTRETQDVYSKATGLNGDRSMVIDLTTTNPSGWELDRHVSVEKPTDAVIWEVHVRDFSSDRSSGMHNQGKYLAFTETKTTVNGAGELTTGLDYLKELGINYVQILPSFDYVNDETDESNQGYNWGYNPKNYNVPEGLYATNPYDGSVRIREFKQMVQALHDAGIGVILDVVYNHVGADAADSCFEKTVPGYYFRYDRHGNFQDSGTACGNETASEREMFRKFMIDSVLYWAEEYHIDGFRFDLMGCHDVATMNQLRSALDQLPGGEKILTYGEPWSAGVTNETGNAVMVSQKNMPLLDSRIGAFNDCIRDVLKGRVFQDASTGFIQAGLGMKQPAGGIVYTNQDLMAGLQGNANSLYPNRWAAAPSQVISYVSAHDNLGLYDKLQYSVNGVVKIGDPRYYERDEKLVRMNKLAAASVICSQGAIFFQAGEEFARTKGGVENSYNAPLYFDEERELNQINWSRRERFGDLHAYYQGLLKLRAAYAPFRAAADHGIMASMTFTDTMTANVIAYTISSPNERWNHVAVIMNATMEEAEVSLQGREEGTLPDVWECVVNQDAAGIDVLEVYQGNTILAPAQTVLILVESNQSV